MISKCKVEGSCVKMLASRRWKVDSSIVGRLNDEDDCENAYPTRYVTACDNDLDWWEKNCWLFVGSDDVERHCSTMSLIFCTELLDASIVLKSTVVISAL